MFWLTSSLIKLVIENRNGLQTLKNIFINHYLSFIIENVKQIEDRRRVGSKQQVAKTETEQE